MDSTGIDLPSVRGFSGPSRCLCLRVGDTVEVAKGSEYQKAKMAKHVATNRDLSCCTIVSCCTRIRKGGLSHAVISGLSYRPGGCRNWRPRQELFGSKFSHMSTAL